MVMSENDSTNNNNDKKNNNLITIKRSTFNKIVIGSIIALAASTFLGGYLLGQHGIEMNRIETTTPQTQINNIPTTAIPQQPSLTQDTTGTSPHQISSIQLDNSPAMGNSNAPVTIVEFSDFQCPFCDAFFTDTLPQIKQEYVDTGKAKFILKEFPLDFHTNARLAANAAECANEQGKFWEYHDVLFKSQSQWENLSNSDASSAFKQSAVDLGLKTSDFNSCLDSKKYDSLVSKESQEGSMYGVSGTPTLYVGNEKNGYTQIVGAQPYSTFKQTIENLLQ